MFLQKFLENFSIESQEDSKIFFQEFVSKIPQEISPKIPFKKSTDYFQKFLHGLIQKTFMRSNQEYILEFFHKCFIWIFFLEIYSPAIFKKKIFIYFFRLHFCYVKKMEKQIINSLEMRP